MCHLLKLWLGFLPRISSFIWRYTTSSWTRSCWILVCNWEVPIGPMPCAYGVESCTMALSGPWRSICRPCQHHQWLGCIGSISFPCVHPTCKKLYEILLVGHGYKLCYHFTSWWKMELASQMSSGYARPNPTEMASDVPNALRNSHLDELLSWIAMVSPSSKRRLLSW